MNYELFKQLLSIDNKKISDEYAYVTHYLQNAQNGVGEIYREKALEFINDRIKNSKTLKWNVPFPPPKKPKFKFIDLFAGIGGFRLALQSQGGKCVFSSEIDNSAKQTYETNFGEYPFGDIRDFSGPNVTDDQLDKLIPDHDVLTGGFPCQPFSLAGVSARNFLGDKPMDFLIKTLGICFLILQELLRLSNQRLSSWKMLEISRGMMGVTPFRL